MKIKNLNINWDKVKKYVGVGIALVIIGEGSLLLLNKQTNIEKENEYLTSTIDDTTYSAPAENTLETIDDTTYSAPAENTLETTDDITYCAPAGYTLETIDGKVYAVCEKTYVIDALKGVNPDGSEYYYLPEGYVLNGSKGYKTVKIVEEPIIVENNQKIK